jgi:hypothetical protein
MEAPVFLRKSTETSYHRHSLHTTLAHTSFRPNLAIFSLINLNTHLFIMRHSIALVSVLAGAVMAADTTIDFLFPGRKLT